VGSRGDVEYNRAIVARIVADRDALATRQRQIPGVEPRPAATNFLLVRLPVANAGPVVQELARRGVYVRHFGNPAHDIADCLRVSIGTPEENAIFADELEAVLGQRERAA
jgi:histidinol-phosphate aminotransferase